MDGNSAIVCEYNLALHLEGFESCKMILVIITLKYFITAWLFTSKVVILIINISISRLAVCLQNDVCDYNLEVLAACLQLFALDNCGVDTSGLNAR